MSRVKGGGALSTHQCGSSLPVGSRDELAPRFHCIPELVADNPKIGPLTDPTFCPRQVPGHFLSSARLSIESFVPRDLFALDALVPQKSTHGPKLP
jgi:hypothetical protein